MKPGPLKVLYVHHIGHALGGATYSLYHLIRALPREQVHPIVLCPPGKVSDFLNKSGIETRNIPGVPLFLSSSGAPLKGARLLDLIRMTWFCKDLPAFGRVLDHVKPDVVHLNERGMIPSAIIARRRGYPVIMHARNVADRQVQWAQRTSLRALDRYADLVVCIDRSVQFSIREVKRTEVVYNPLHLQKLDELPRRIRSSGKVRIAFLAGLLPIKGIWDLVAAAEILSRTHDFILKIAGTNSRPPEFYQSSFGKLCQALGLAQDVETELKKRLAQSPLKEKVVLLGHVNAESCLLESDILVFPSHFNGPGRSVFEAGIYGVPAVVSMRDRIEDIVEHGKTGLIVPERDPASLAKALASLIDDAEMRESMGKAAREKYLKQFDPANSARKMTELYYSLIQNRQTASKN